MQGDNSMGQLGLWICCLRLSTLWVINLPSYLTLASEAVPPHRGHSDVKIDEDDRVSEMDTNDRSGCIQGSGARGEGGLCWTDVDLGIEY